ncbi:MAG: hypothetical protein D3925_03150 [Candidatus Electrothrix sp. AR5]|nr:hypothetical protein [Candidatus Electrothrix sp. AR5]
MLLLLKRYSRKNNVGRNNPLHAKRVRNEQASINAIFAGLRYYLDMVISGNFKGTRMYWIHRESDDEKESAENCQMIYFFLLYYCLE